MESYNRLPAPATEAPADEYRMTRFIREMDAWVDDMADAEDARLEALAADGDESDPETWGDEWDSDVWVPTDYPADDESGPFEPSDEDLDSLHVIFDDQRDWDELADWIERVDILAGRVGIEPEHIARSVAGCVHESALV